MHQQYFSQQSYTSQQPQRVNNNPTHQQQFGLRQPTASGQHVQYTTQPSESVRIAHGFTPVDMQTQYNQMLQPQYQFNRQYAPARQTYAQTQRLLQQAPSAQQAIPEQTLRNLLQDPYAMQSNAAALNRGTINDHMILQRQQERRMSQESRNLIQIPRNQLSSPPPLTHQPQTDHRMQPEVSRTNNRIQVEIPRTNLTQQQIQRQLMSSNAYARVTSTTPSALYQTSNPQMSTAPQPHFTPTRVPTTGLMQSPPHQRIHITFSGTPHTLTSPTTSFGAQQHQPSAHDRLSAMESMLTMPQRSFPSESKPDMQQPRFTENKVVVKRQTSSVHSNNAVLIIRDSDSETDSDNEQTPGDRKDKVKIKTEPLAPKVDKRIVIDDDIEITGIQEAEIMSHVRGDCPIHAFTVVNSVESGPVSANTKRCGKCFCYICDRTATECQHWTDSNCPHCNAHAKASCWKARRNNKKSPLMAALTGEELTSELRIAADMSQQYMIRIREAYITYRTGTSCLPEVVPCNCHCHKTETRDRDQTICPQCKSVHDMRKKFNYAPVREVTIQTVLEIHNKYSLSAPLSALVMLEAVLSELCSHRPADFNHVTKNQSNPDVKCQCNTPQVMDQYIEKELVNILSRHEVPRSFLTKLKRCVEQSVQPLQLKDTLKRFLTMRHWGDDHLLRMVLSGGNLKSTKNRDMLRETQDMFNNRIEKLDREGRYQSIIRYIKAVKILPQLKNVQALNEREQNKQELMLLYSAKQGLFRDVCLQLLMPKRIQPESNLTFLHTFGATFMLDLLDILAGYKIPPETKLQTSQSFNKGVSGDQKYVIVNKDATVLVYLVLFVMEVQNAPHTQVACCEWLCKLVNRNQLAAIENLHYLRQLLDVSRSIREHIRQMCMTNRMNDCIAQCQPLDGYVHLYVAMMTVLHIYSANANNITLTRPFVTNTMQTFKTNEWAFFNLLCQSPVNIPSNHPEVLQWVITYTKKVANSTKILRNLSLSNLIVKIIEKCDLRDICEMLTSMIPVEMDLLSDAPVFEVVQQCAGAFAGRLHAELSQRQEGDFKRLSKACEWLNAALFQKLSKQNVLFNVHSTPKTLELFQKIGQLCCTLLPSSESFQLLRKVFSDIDWSRNMFSLLPFIQGQIVKGHVGMGGLSAVLSFILEVGSEQHFVDAFKDFLEKHACSFEKDLITGAMILDEVARLIEHGPASTNKKAAMVKSCCMLVVHETLSWLICTRCAEKMPLNWVGVWKALAKVDMRSDLERLNNQAMIQIGSWLKELSLKTMSDYERLLACLRRFFAVLASCWCDCDFNVDLCQRMVNDTARNIKDHKLQRDYMRLLAEAVTAEKKKRAPPKPSPTPPAAPANKPPIPSQPAHTQPQPMPTRPQQASSQSKPPPPNHPTPTSTNRPSHPTPTLKQHTPIQSAQQPKPTPPQPKPVHTEKPSVSSTTKKSVIANQNSKETPSRPKVIHQNIPDNHKPVEMQTQTVISEVSDAAKHQSAKLLESKTLKNNLIEQFAKETTTSTNNLKRPAQSQTPPKPTKVALPANSPFSQTPPNRSKLCPKCGSSVSCASFKCPNCNEVTRSVKTVKCPGCSQENHNLKGYSCMFCYRSLMDVIFNDKKTRDANMREIPQAQTDGNNASPPADKKEKKKPTHKRKKKFKSSEKVSVNGAATEAEILAKNDDANKVVSAPAKKVVDIQRAEPDPSRTNYKEASATSLTDSSSDTDTADNLNEQPPLKRKKSVHIYRDNGLQGSDSSDHRVKQSSRLSADSDSDSEPPKITFGGRSWKQQTSSESAKHAALAKWRLSDKVPSAEPKKEPPRPHTMLKITKSRSGFEASTSTINSFSASKPIPQPQTHSQTPLSPQRLGPVTSESPSSPSSGVKKAIGHSSSMSKHQKNMLSRMRAFGRKQVTKAIKSPPQNTKRLSVENSSDETSGAGLSFSLAKVTPKKKLPSTQLRNTIATNDGILNNASEGSPAEHSGVPDSEDDFSTNKPRKKIKKKKKRTLEEEYNFYLEYRKPGPASKTGYRQLLKLRRKYLREQYRKWKISPDIFVSEDVDLTATCTIPLRQLHESQMHLVKAVVRDDVEISDLYT